MEIRTRMRPQGRKSRVRRHNRAASHAQMVAVTVARSAAELEQIRLEQHRPHRDRPACRSLICSSLSASSFASCSTVFGGSGGGPFLPLPLAGDLGGMPASTGERAVWTGRLAVCLSRLSTGSHSHNRPRRQHEECLVFSLRPQASDAVSAAWRRLAAAMYDVQSSGEQKTCAIRLSGK